MTKNQIVSIMGNSYTSEIGVKHPDGNIQVISYDSVEFDSSDNARYVFRFQNGDLIEWFREIVPAPVVVAPTPGRPNSRN